MGKGGGVWTQRAGLSSWRDSLQLKRLRRSVLLRMNPDPGLPTESFLCLRPPFPPPPPHLSNSYAEPLGSASASAAPASLPHGLFRTAPHRTAPHPRMIAALLCVSSHPRLRVHHSPLVGGGPVSPPLKSEILEGGDPHQQALNLCVPALGQGPACRRCTVNVC